MATLVSFAGLPGTGKSTIAAALSRRTGAIFLRIDEIEAAIRTHGTARDIGPEGYHIAAGLAASNLLLGHDAITDCVNPWPLTRAIFSDAARRGEADMIGVEVTCSDAEEHRRRIETRPLDVPGGKPPDWKGVQERDYTPWLDADLHIDTAMTSVEEAVLMIAERLAA
ncbi:AAA domain-containing protein [Breoghania corrubedonensis]|uniref:AAA domain-containing protein n=1 Tax=Breoghania corrubedonensis TaxID=665038 RepID=A0A2T5VCJ2_9HYPH|nr:AAA family ATPase [Breoghania corrubedonensis]PTW61483.1 AAA domain-containing protein [Breoghania corrubedonensis]